MSPRYFLLCLAYTATAADASTPSLIMAHSVARNRRLLLDWPRAFGLARDTLVEVLSLNVGINLVALIALNSGVSPFVELKFPQVPVLYILLA